MSAMSRKEALSQDMSARPVRELSTQELIGELRMRDDVFCVQAWLDDDVLGAHPGMSTEELAEFKRTHEGPFDDRMTEFGTEMLADE